MGNHELLTPYPVLYEKDGEYVAQSKFTVLLMPNGPLRITHGAWDPECVQSEFSIKDEELRKILTSQVSKKTQKTRKNLLTKLKAQSQRRRVLLRSVQMVRPRFHRRETNIELFCCICCCIFMSSDVGQIVFYEDDIILK